MPTLILLRHGQSMWNAQNLFTGWVDIPLSQQGIQEAEEAGKQLKDTPLDFVWMSTLIRAQSTAMIALAQHTSSATPLVHSSQQPEDWGAIHSEKTAGNTLPIWIDDRLNERYYGELQGLNKAETIEKHGADQVQLWRRSFDTPPPNGESLAMTYNRTIPCLTERIEPLLKQNQSGLVCAHGNSLRSIIMHIEQLTPEEILQVEIPTGVPLFYQYDNGIYQKIEKPS